MKQHFFKKNRLLFLLSGTFVMMIVMARSGATLKTPATPLGILDLEFAWNASEAGTVINAWTGYMPVDNIFVAIMNTWLDFIFLVFYALFLNHSCKLLALSFKGTFHAIGNFLAKGALVAGALDILENIGMLITLNGHISDINTLFTCIFSILKWLLALAAILYTLIAGAMVFYKKTVIRSVTNPHK